MKRFSTAILAALLACSCGCAKARQRPNVVLITIDALRPDHMSCYGYHRNTTPFIDSLASRGFVFSNCQSVANWTAPSLASLFTSVYPRSHGVLHGFAQSREIHGQEVLAPSFLTLAEAMKAGGYSTFAVAGTGHASAETGMAQGFDRFHGLWFPRSPMIHSALVDLRKDLHSGRPFFLWVHYFSPHAPYLAHKPWIDRYARHPELVNEYAGKQPEWLRNRVREMKDRPEVIETIIDLYDNEINDVDGFVQRLFEEVLPGGDTLAIITSDHGEAFLEHGALAHAESLFEEELRIPLIVVAPGLAAGAGKTVLPPVCSVDVYPTILDITGISTRESVQGVSLLPLLRGMPGNTNRPVFAEFDRTQVPIRSVTLDGWKLITSENCTTVRMLFDLRSDPGETRNLMDERPDVASRLENIIRARMEEVKPFQAPRGTMRLTQEQEKVLRSLGYLK